MKKTQREQGMEVLFADKHMVVAVKPAGILSQDAGENSMPHLLRQQLSVEEVHVVHRLDKEVGGVMVYGLTQKAAAGLCRAVQNREMEKIYLAVLRGVPSDKEGVLEDLLFHDRQRNKTYVVDRQRKGVKDAKLDYTLLETAQERSLVRVRLHTGRTHQIRVQFASRKLPLVGDGKYGGKEPGSKLGLWCHSLSFAHPVTGKQLSFAQNPPVAAPWDVFTIK